VFKARRRCAICSAKQSCPAVGNGTPESYGWCRGLAGTPPSRRTSLHAALCQTGLPRRRGAGVQAFGKAQSRPFNLDCSTTYRGGTRLSGTVGTRLHTQTVIPRSGSYPVESRSAFRGVWFRQAESSRGVWFHKLIAKSKSLQIACGTRLHIDEPGRLHGC
jgi:hypothetical protein